LCTKVLNRPHGYGIQYLRNVNGKLRDETSSLGLSRLPDVDAVVADFNGDGRPDIAELTPTLLRVSLQQPSGRFVPVATVAVKWGQGLAAGDANGDGHPDLYVLQGNGRSNAPDSLLLNDGSGRRWHSFPIPETSAGGADSVVALDYDRNGLTDFLVLNGMGKPGPIQLIAFFRTNRHASSGTPGAASIAASRGRGQ